MIILSQSKHPEEREFYLRMAIQEKWSKRELERQLKAALFERSITQPAKASAVLKQTHPAALEIFRDAYMVEFLDLPGVHAETDLHRGLLGRLKEFLIELGRDFCFVGSGIRYKLAAVISPLICCSSIVGSTVLSPSSSRSDVLSLNIWAS